MRFNVHTGVSVVVGTLALAQAAGWGQAGPAGGEDGAEALIEQLASPSPREREAAAARLGKMGIEARAALERAAASPDPAIAQQARSLLRSMPWYEPEDPQAVRTLLNNYREKTGAERVIGIDEIALQGSSEAGIALLRIVQQESSEPMRWRAAQALRTRARQDDRRLLRSIPHETRNTALLGAVAWAWETVDEAKSIDLYREVMRLEADRPTRTMNAGDTEQALRLRRVRVGGAIQVLAMGPRRMEDLPLAPAVLRLQQVAIANEDWALLGEAWRSFARHLQEEPEWRPRAVRMLFSMHARFGPLPGIQSDLRAFEAELGKAVEAYLLAEIARRSGFEALADELARAAFGQNFGAPLERSQVAAELLQDHWYEPAERELRAILTEPPLFDVEADLKRVLTVVSHMTLAHIVGNRGDDAAAAAHLEQAIADGQGLPEVAVRPLVAAASTGVDGAREQLHWRRLRAAKAAGNEAEVTAQLEALQALWPKDADVLFDVNSELRARGQADAAARLAEAAIKPMRERLPTPTSANEMNELAWIYARSGERLEEARALARRAVEMDSNNAAYLDTLAEAEFLNGDAAEAVRLETRALQLAPGMPFMESQLQRYREKLDQ